MPSAIDHSQFQLRTEKEIECTALQTTDGGSTNENVAECVLVAATAGGTAGCC